MSLWWCTLCADSKWMVLALVSEDTDFCIKSHNCQAAWLPVPVVAEVSTGKCTGVPWYSSQRLLKLMSLSIEPKANMSPSIVWWRLAWVSCGPIKEHCPCQQLQSNYVIKPSALGHFEQKLLHQWLSLLQYKGVCGLRILACSPNQGWAVHG